MAKKTKILTVLLSIVAAFIMIFMLVQTYAANSKYLGITGTRLPSEEYKITSLNPQKTVWKIVSYDSMQDNATARYDEAIYCINPEIGFGSEASNSIAKREYNISFNMKDLSNVAEPYKSMFSDTTKYNYNAILWILDNIYLVKGQELAPTITETEKVQMKELLLEKAGITRKVLTDNDIDVVQQMALWYFSSTNAKYHFEPADFPSIAINGTAIEEIGKPLTTEGRQRYDDMKTLYTYFINSAKANASLYGTTDIKKLKEPNIKFTKPVVDNSLASVETIGTQEYFLSGPYNFTETNKTKIPYTIEASILDQKNTAVTGYKLLSATKAELPQQTIDEKLLDTDFYIAIPTANNKITSLNLKLDLTYFNTSVECWTNQTSYATEQPVVIVNKQKQEQEIKVTTKIEQPEFDLALRKFITKIDDKEITSRVPVVDVSKLINKTSTTATYTHPKEPISVKNGNKVTYTIRIYNEGQIAGYAKEITDDIPEGLKFLVNDPTNIEYMWKLSQDGTKITTKYLSMEKDDKNLILGFDSKTMSTLPYKDVKVVFEVIEPNTSDRILTNTAEITNDSDSQGKDIEDRDSTPNNGIKTEDDIDVEHVKLGYFDLALRKFITKVNNQEVTPSREPVADVSKIIDGTSTTATYTHSKTPVAVQTGDIVTYTIRVYNEGKISGYAEEITDYLPEGLQFVSAENSSINAKYKWQLSEDKKKITTTYLSEANSDKTSNDPEKNFLIEAFDKTIQPATLSYKEVKVECKVIAKNTSSNILRNIAEISKDGNNDIDSVPNNVDINDYTPPADNSKYQQDDDDYEDLKLQYFDLSLRKFITKVNSQEVTTRIPVVSKKDGNLIYTHTKEPVLVANNDIVVYTIRVYNEGKIAGYAKEVSDDIPVGLTYLPEHEINKTYNWVLSEDSKTISTDYLSKEKSDERKENNLLKAFDSSKEISAEEPLNPDYRDLKVAFKVTEKNISTDRIIINTAEITDDSDENGNDIKDEDSTPDNWKDGEDDIDKEYLKVKYFDLALLKWVSKVYVTENGKTTTTNTGHTGLENPEPIVKVDLDRKKLSNVTVKFGYTIKVTNEGQIAGYAKEVSDYIPAGLKFVKSDNPDWEIKDGKIVTRKLENTLLKPGESATVTVILTWINDKENTGVKVNVAEISEDYNENNSKDIDSTPNNKKDGEDDIDDAPVMLALKTGSEPVYIILITSILAILGSGIFLIKKYVLG